LIDENLKLYMTELNMSPGITADRGRVDIKSAIFEQVVYNLVKLVGISNKADLMAVYVKFVFH
jgi:hypothetical protein